MRQTFVLLALLIASVIATAAETGLRELWGSPGYKSKPVPEIWKSKKIPPTVRDVSAFVGFHSQSVFITNFIAAYGLPDHYLVAAQREGQDFLLYDLAKGQTAALYVSKPPAEVFGAIVVVDRRGDLVKLIK